MSCVMTACLDAARHDAVAGPARGDLTDEFCHAKDGLVARAFLRCATEAWGQERLSY
jgi:hypothetical protein